MVAICQTKPEIVTVTEQRQLCTNEKNEKNYATTKICITYKDGSWYCKNLVNIKNQEKLTDKIDIFELKTIFCWVFKEFWPW